MKFCVCSNISQIQVRMYHILLNWLSTEFCPLIDVKIMFQFTVFCLLIIIIIITLFQEDNIFCTNASLTYGPQIQRHACVRLLENNEDYLQYVQSWWGLRTSSMLRTGYLTLLAWRGKYDLSRLKAVPRRYFCCGSLLFLLMCLYFGSSIMLVTYFVNFR